MPELSNIGIVSAFVAGIVVLVTLRAAADAEIPRSDSVTGST